ncbi:cytidine deaminase [Euzebya sp.]|uniref:cytidine deaminase n=1 Tax=Euzebya sp. TaxID=1971409 RepID=UPI00351361A0
MTTDLEGLLARARDAQQQAYVPYSGFRVGAALECEDGTVVEGCNVENAAYPATICAERTAVAAAVAAGHRRFRAIAVIGSGEGPTTPCGMCRQVLFEFAPDLVVHAAGADGGTATYVLGRDLLPDGFGPRRLDAGQGH